MAPRQDGGPTSWNGGPEQNNRGWSRHRLSSGEIRTANRTRAPGKARPAGRSHGQGRLPAQSEEGPAPWEKQRVCQKLHSGQGLARTALEVTVNTLRCPEQIWLKIKPAQNDVRLRSASAATHRQVSSWPFARRGLRNAFSRLLIGGKSWRWQS